MALSAANVNKQKLNVFLYFSMLLKMVHSLKKYKIFIIEDKLITVYLTMQFHLRNFS